MTEGTRGLCMGCGACRPSIRGPLEVYAADSGIRFAGNVSGGWRRAGAARESDRAGSGARRSESRRRSPCAPY